MAIKKKKINSKKSTDDKSIQEQIDEIRALVEENLHYTKSLKKSENSPEQGLQRALQENLKISKELYRMMGKINKWVLWQRIWMVFKILIIIVPIALGIIYLPPLLADLIDPYKDLLNFGSFGGQVANPVDGVGGIDGNTINQILERLNNGEIEIQLPE